MLIVEESHDVISPHAARMSHVGMPPKNIEGVYLLLGQENHRKFEMPILNLEIPQE